MIGRLRRTLRAIAAATAAAIAVSGPAVGHGGEARLTLEPPTVNPGGTVLVLGDDLSADDRITISISGQAGRVDLGVGRSDGSGHFSEASLVPVVVPVGSYLRG